MMRILRHFHLHFPFNMRASLVLNEYADYIMSSVTRSSMLTSPVSECSNGCKEVIKQETLV